MADKIFINDLKLQVVIGVNEGERNIKQNVEINITIFADLIACGESDCIRDTINYSTLTKAVMQYTETSHHYTLEALATGIARVCCLRFNIDKVIVHVDKPGALKLARSPGVEIERTKKFFESSNTGSLTDKNDGLHRVYIALGSNIDDRRVTICKALNLLRASGHVISTSFLYETPPAYVVDQPTFLNAVCKYETPMDAESLLGFLQSIEKQLGRQPTIRYGPRTVDLDILYYDNSVINLPQLIIPHPGIHERDFVLEPLKDIAPDFIHPILHRTTSQLYSTLLLNSKPTSAPSIKQMLPVRNRLLVLGTQTYIMGVVNVTPDSFSDGGKYFGKEDAVARALQLIEQGADIIDIGGQSTKPGAVRISEDDELTRVIPVIKGLREKNTEILLSIDTFYAKVAEAALVAGVDIINDVTGGTHDAAMFDVAAKLSVPIVLMHSQPTPQYNLQQKGLDYSSSTIKYDVVDEVLSFFRSRAVAAYARGVNSWQLIFDPGLGFYKTYEQSIELIRRAKQLTSTGFPILMGPSRKGFVGHIVGEPDPQGPKRLWGTLACSVAAAGAGVCIVRVHDVAEAWAALRTADAIYK